MSALNQPLAWMDAVAQERAAQAQAQPSVEDLTQTITAFHAEHHLPLTEDEARGAAQRCLAQPAQRVPAVQVPWNRPVSHAAWTSQMARLERQARFLKHLMNWPTGVSVVSMIGLSVAGALALSHWTGLAELIPMGVGMGLAGHLAMEASVSTSAKLAHEKRVGWLRRLRPFAPGDQDIEAIAVWMKIPRMAHWLAQLRHGEVPLLQGDLEELRGRAHQEWQADHQRGKTEAFLGQLDRQITVLDPAVLARASNEALA